MAIIHALLVTMLIAAMAAGASTLAQVELRIADYHRASREAVYAARGAAAIAIHELRDMPDWTPALSGVVRGAFTSDDVPGGAGAICCGGTSLTVRLRTSSGRPWTVLGWSPATRLLGTPDSRLYVAVWVADDPGDADGDPSADSNSAVILHAEARREDGLAAAVEAIVERVSPAGSGLYLEHPPSTNGSNVSAAPSVRLRSWREP